MSDTFLTRPRDGKQLAGVCAELAKRFDMDRTLMRVLLGVGLIAYPILCVVIPAEQ